MSEGKYLGILREWRIVGLLKGCTRGLYWNHRVCQPRKSWIHSVEKKKEKRYSDVEKVKRIVQERNEFQCLLRKEYLRLRSKYISP